MIKYKKPSGIEVEVNDNQATIDYVESLGWIKEGEGLSLEDMTKDQIAKYAKERFGIDLVVSKNKDDLIVEVKALEDDNRN